MGQSGWLQDQSVGMPHADPYSHQECPQETRTTDQGQVKEPRRTKLPGGELSVLTDTGARIMDSRASKMESAPDKDDSKQNSMPNSQELSFDQNAGLPHVGRKPASRDREFIVENVRTVEEQTASASDCLHGNDCRQRRQKEAAHMPAEWHGTQNPDRLRNQGQQVGICPPQHNVEESTPNASKLAECNLHDQFAEQVTLHRQRLLDTVRRTDTPSVGMGIPICRDTGSNQEPAQHVINSTALFEVIRT